MTNETGNSSSAQATFENSEYRTIHLFFGLLGCAGLAGNLVVVAIIVHNRRLMLDLPSSWFVLSLAIADAVFSATGIPAMYGLCKGASYIYLGVAIEFLTIASAGNLFILTFNRFLSVYNSLRYPALMTTGRAKVLLVLPWVTAFCLCGVVWISCEAGVHHILYLLSAYYTTLVLLTSALNIYMFKIARDKRTVTARQQWAVHSPSRKLLDKEHCLSVRLLLVTLTFFGACIPTIVLLFLYPTMASRQTRSFKRKFIWCFMAALFNAAVNPFIYTTNHPILKRYFSKTRNRVFPQRSVGVLTEPAQSSAAVTGV